MNCRPGDLAVIVRSEGWGLAGEIARLCIGRIVQVRFLRPPFNSACPSALVWDIEKPLIVSKDGHDFEVTGVSDDALRPIRDPGDDAVDEMLLRVPSPSEPVT